MTDKIKEEITQSQKISNMIKPFSDILDSEGMRSLFNRIEYLIEDGKKATKTEMIKEFEKIIRKLSDDNIIKISQMFKILKKLQRLGELKT